MNYGKLFGACAATAATGYFGYLLPHTVFLENVRVNWTRFRLGKELHVPENIQDMVKNVMMDMQLPEDVRNRIKVFDVFGFDLYHSGLISTKYGALLGIPVNFTFPNVDAIPKEDIKLLDLPIDWTRKDSQEFLKGLVISEKAQKAAIANTILRIKINEPHYHAFLAGTWMASTLATYQMLKGKVQSKKQFGVLLCSGALVLWLYMSDYLVRLMEESCDKKMVELGSEYVSGFKEYLDTITNRNVAYRSLLGEYGTTVFRENGDQKFWLMRSKVLPLSARRDFFTSKVSEYAMS